MSEAARICVACSGSLVPWGLREGFELLRCPGCGTIARAKQPEEADLAKLYNESLFDAPGRSDYYYRDEVTQAINCERKWQQVSAFCPRPARLLDIGTAFGYFLKHAPDGWEVEGCDISVYAGRRAVEINKVKVRQGGFLSLDFPEACFDVITMWDYLEHVPDPMANLLRARELIKDGGALFITTGDADSWLARLLRRRWRLIKPSQHLYCFGARGLDKMLGRARFKPVSVTAESRAFNLSYLLNTCWLARIPWLGRCVRFVAEKMHWRLRVCLGDIIQVVARAQV